MDFYKIISDNKDFIALWGAITGSLALLLQFRTHLSDRHKLKVAIQADVAMNSEKTDATTEIQFELRNVGRRICRIEKIYFIAGWPLMLTLAIFNLFGFGKKYILFEAKRTAELINLDEGEKETIAIKLDTLSQLPVLQSFLPIFVETTDGQRIAKHLPNVGQIRLFIEERKNTKSKRNNRKRRKS